MNLAADYRRCAGIASRHYENFTVASRLVPRRLRPHMHAIYAFCRGVDDLGDEFSGDRMAALAAWEDELRRCYGGRPARPEFRALQASIARFDLPVEPFLALIEANRRDQVRTRYGSFADLMDYCTHSACPVGRLVLALWGHRDEMRGRLSDATCTALQLANFWQDMGRDLDAGRLYVPGDDLARFELTCDDLLRLRRGMSQPWPDRAAAAGRVRGLIAFEIGRTRELFLRGAALERTVPRRLAFQLRLYRMGGEAVLAALEGTRSDPLRLRPAIGGWRKAGIAARALFAGGGRRAPAAGGGSTAKEGTEGAEARRV